MKERSKATTESRREGENESKRVRLRASERNREKKIYI